jgi:hypothetical protein
MTKGIWMTALAAIAMATACHDDGSIVVSQAEWSKSASGDYQVTGQDEQGAATFLVASTVSSALTSAGPGVAYPRPPGGPGCVTCYCIPTLCVTSDPTTPHCYDCYCSPSTCAAAAFSR